MNIRLCSIVLAACIGTAGCFGNADQSVITVEGRGYAYALPDQFSIDFEIDVGGATQDAALRDAATRLDAIRAELPGLEGLTHFSLTTSDADIRATYDSNDCSGYRSDLSSCEITGFRVNIGGSLTGSPALEAGDALSLVSELGATSASLDEFSITDADSIRAQAQAGAARSARQQADEIAQSLGLTVTGVRAVRGPGLNSFPNINELETRDDVLVVTGSRIAMVPLDLAIEPIEFDSELIVQFDLGPAAQPDSTD